MGGILTEVDQTHHCSRVYPRNNYAFKFEVIIIFIMDKAKVHDTLGALVEVHSTLMRSIDFATNNKARAIWYLQGAAISTTYGLWQMYERGLAVPASHEWRYLNEIRDLVQLFENMKDSDRRINAWYRGEVVERRRYEKLAAAPNMPPGFYDEESKVRRQLSDLLSKFIHPTLSVARYNVHKTPFGEFFAYDWNTLKGFNEILIIVKTALICSIHSLLIPAKSLPLSQEERQKLKLLYNVVESWDHK